MFGIGMQEIVLICVIALVVVGPKRMPELARALGKGYGEFRRAFDQMRRSVETDFQTDEIRRSLLDLPPRPAAVPARPSESLLTQQPAGTAAASDPLPYPEMLDGSPPPPEEPESNPHPDRASSSGQAHG